MVTPKKIIQTVVDIGFLSKAQIDQAVNEQLIKPRSIKRIFQELGFISGDEFLSSLLPQLGILPAPLSVSNPPINLTEKIPANFAREHRVAPIKLENDIVTIATDEPLNFLVVNNLQTLLGLKEIRLEITTTESLENYLKTVYSIEKEDLTPLLSKLDKGYTGELGEETTEILSLIGEGEEALLAPVAKLASAIIADAARKRCSDIHVEPLEEKLRVRYRVDGVLHEAVNPPKTLQGPLIARLKLMAGMDLAEKRLPQDGRIMLNVAGRPIDLRVSTLPGIYGESLVMRILDKTTMLLSMNQLGFLQDDQKKWEELLRYSGGIVLVTGPTGSGKTTTLYTSLSALNTTDRKIMTAEEPVEYQIEGINQTHVRPDIKLTFSSVLRSFLRQAPDVILVGEIRDFETADVALRAALTGHLVFSTLHTNDATSAPTRLIDLGVEPFLVSSSLQGAMAQRLVRMLCPACKVEDEPNPNEKELLRIQTGEEVKLCRPAGCSECNNSGFRGRKGIFEIFIMDDELRQLILHKQSSSKIRTVARTHGMRTMGEDGLRKVKMGLTTYDEVISSTTLE
ncbi:MAG: ATPase, T2SS/T4P/T4SS family [Candidatus Omnitrophota bacterium]